MDSYFNSLPPLASASEMRAWDSGASEFGMPEIMLMENAGHALKSAMQDFYGPLAGKSVAIFTGPGNNGGDGFCLARLLKDSEAFPFIFALRTPEELKGAAACHAQLALKAGVPLAHLEPMQSVQEFGAQILAQTGALPDILADCLLGTGLERELTLPLRMLVDNINAFASRMRTPIAAVDIPSGLNSETGQPMPIAIRANLTITLAAAKRGMLLPQAAEFCGRIICREIGIPANVREELAPLWHLLDGHCFSALPPSPQNSFKNQFGHVLVIGGAEGFSGAAHLACAAALRAGCGLVSAYAPADSLSQIKAGWPEIMTRSACAGAAWLEKCRPDFSFASSIVIGPGLTRSENAARLLEYVLQVPDRPPCVIDADALMLLAHNEALFANLQPGDVITPHPGEAGALLHCPASEIQTDRIQALDMLCAKTPAVVVLKGVGTLVAQRGDAHLLCPYDIPDLAIGGAGDVLAGCIGALLCDKRLPGYSALARASLGVAIHALAALQLSASYPARGFTASQLADTLPHAGAASNKKPIVQGLLPWPQP